MTTQLVLKADMVGYKSLTVSNSDLVNFNPIALDTQNNVSRELLGDKLFGLFSNDLDGGSGVPTEQKWLDLLNGVTWTDTMNNDDSDDDVDHITLGLKAAWDYFVYREWLNQNQFSNTFVGKSVNATENSTRLDRQQMNIEAENRYNQGVEIYRTIMEFVNYYKDYKVDYSSITELAGVYTVNLIDTTYLKVGNKVTIDGIDYIAASVSEGAFFTFNAATGLTFTNDFVEWFPFEDAALSTKGKLFFNGML